VSILYTFVQRLSVSQARGRAVARSVFESMGQLVIFTDCSAVCVAPGNFVACGRPLIDYKYWGFAYFVVCSRSPRLREGVTWEMPTGHGLEEWLPRSGPCGGFRGANTGKRMLGGGVRFLLCQFRRREGVSKALR